MKNTARGLALVQLALVSPALGQTVFATDIFGESHGGKAGDRVITFDAADPLAVTVLGHTGIANKPMTGLAFANGVLYAYSSSLSSGNLYTLDPTTGSATFIGGGGVLGGDWLTDIAWSEVDQALYAVNYRSIGSLRFYQIDLTSGMATLAFELSDPTTQIEVATLAIDPVTNEFYVHDFLTKRLYVSVGGTLQGMPKGVGFPGGSYGMTFDPNTKTLFLGAWNTGPYRSELRTADLSTGATTSLGFIGPFNDNSGYGEYLTGDIAIAMQDCETTKYCNPAAGSNQNVATIDISGCDLSGGVSVKLSNAPAGESTYLLIGDGNQIVSQPPGAIGDLCIVGGSCIGRYALDVGTISADGTFSTPISNSKSGGPNFGIPTCGGNIQAGETWYFQFWHRQPMGQPSTFSEAIGVKFK